MSQEVPIMFCKKSVVFLCSTVNFLLHGQLGMNMKIFQRNFRSLQLLVNTKFRIYFDWRVLSYISK